VWARSLQALVVLVLMRRTRAKKALWGAATMTSFVVLSVVYGCSYDWTYVDPSTRDGGSERGDEEAKEGGPEFDTRPPEPPPPQGDCKSAKDCSVGKQYCFFKDGLCGPERGPSNVTGICTDISSVCPAKPEANLCSCEGSIVPNRCEAAQKGFDIDQSQTSCVKPGATFSCVGVAGGCKTGVEYCQVKAANPTQGACVVLTTCTAPSVSCSKCGNPGTPACTCKDDGPQVLRVDCP
jgi:hypothetical protein